MKPLVSILIPAYNAQKLDCGLAPVGRGKGTANSRNEPGECKLDVLCGVEPGALDGMTILRYTHSYRERSSGGIEQQLRHLNRGLLERHRMTILQTHLVREFPAKQIEVEKTGQGQIVWVPIAWRVTPSRFASLPARALYAYRQTLQRCRQDGAGEGRAAYNAVKAVLLHKLGALRHRAVYLSDHLGALLLKYQVDLLAVHWLTYDTETLIATARETGVPFVVVNHFENKLLSEPRMQRWLPHAAGIGGISGRAVPSQLSGRFVNLLNGVDVDYFSPDRAGPAQPANPPMILMPALVKATKGHSDLLRAARILAARNVDFQVCCPGAVEDDALLKSLRRYVAENGLERKVAFLGEISQEQMRDYYAQSTLVVLPTYFEGLGRVLIEAQAMKKPVVAYDSGGVAETLLPNETGFLVRTGDVEGLADSIAFFLLNPAERLSFGETGRRYVVGKFGVPALVGRHERFYFQAISGRTGRGARRWAGGEVGS